MERDVKIYFKVDGIDGYITNLNELNTALGKVNTSTDEASLSTSNFSDDIDSSRDKITAFKGAVDILGGSVEVLVGGLGLLGAQPAWLEDLEQGAANAFAFADGMSRLADGITDVREFMKGYTLATKANTTAINAQNTATKAATISTRTLSSVLKGAGIGLVIAGLAALAANWEKVLGFLGLGAKEFEGSLEAQIKSLEKEQQIQDIRGQTAREASLREAEIAQLRAQNATNYLAYLREIGASEEEINEAVKNQKDAMLELELAIERAETAQNNFNDAQQDMLSQMSDDRITQYYEQLAFYTQQSAEYEFYSLKQRQDANKIYFDALKEQARLQTSDRIVELNKQLEAGEISEETYNQLVTEARQELNNKLIELDGEREVKSTEITQQSWNKRLDLAGKAVQAIMALNDATAGASEAEQKKAFERNKKLQIGLATIQTAQAVTAALTAGGNPIKLATGAQFVEAGIAAATGLAQIIAIKRTQWNGGDTGNLSTSNGANPSTISYSPQQQNIESIQPGQLSSGRSASPQPIQAYVLVSDVNNAQQANNQIENLARL